MGKFFERCVELLRFLRRILLIKDLYWATKLTTFPIPLQDVQWDKKSGKLLLKKLDIEIGKEQNQFLLNGYHWASMLTDLRRAQFHLNEHDEVLVNVDGIVANPKTRGELYNLKEIYVDGIYNVLFTSPVVVLDIGMNAGLASIFFASKPDVEVVGFEPFQETYNHALHNFELNPVLAGKIQAFNYGLSDKNCLVSAQYNREIADHLGVYEIDGKPGEDLHFLPEQIKLEDVRQVLDWVVANYPGRGIVAKIDCEGSEYEIIRALAESKKLGYLEAIMMEWHIRNPLHNPAELIVLLKDQNFNIFVPKPDRKTEGMVYAFKSNFSN